MTIGASDGEVAVMRRVIGLVMNASEPPRWDQLAPAQISAIRGSYFLLDADPTGDAETFATRVLDRLLLQLRRTTERQQVSRRGHVAGRIVWPATLKARNCEEHDPTRFVSQRVRFDFDTLENQLIRYLVERLLRCVRAVPDVIRTGTSVYPALLLEGTAGAHGVMSTAARLGRIEAALNMFRRDPRARGVTLLDRIDARHLAAADVADLLEYRFVAAVARRYQSVVLGQDWTRELSAIGQRVLLLPGSVGADSEPWMRLGAGLLRGGPE